METKYYIYLNYGAGDTLITPYNMALKLKWKRGVINDFIARKELTGSFTLIGSQFTAANTFFITNGNFKAGIKVYENGVKGAGVLQFDGWARTTGEWDYRENKVTLNSFETNDQYTGIIPFLDNQREGEGLSGFGSYNEFHGQGQSSNANKLYRFTFSGSAFLISPSPTAVTNVGRVASTGENGEVVLIDSANRTLESYTVAASAWSLNRSLSGLPFEYKEIAMTGLGSSQVAVLGSDGYFAIYQYSGVTFATVTSLSNIGDFKNPSMALAGTRLIIVDELSKTFKEFSSSTNSYGNSLSVGDITKPSICTLNVANNRFAFIDAKQKELRAYSYSGTTFSQVGTGLSISGLFAPVITFYRTDQVILHDTIKGTLQMYTFSGTAWSQTGSTYNIGGGYMSSVGCNGTEIMLTISDTFPFNGSSMHSYYGLTNALLFVNNIWGTTAPKYELQTSGNGSTIDVNNLILGNMSDIADNFEDAGNYNRYKYSLKTLFKWLELFQNYWYIDDNKKIKFIQPNLFSSQGTDIDVSSMDAPVELNQRTYTENFLVDKEDLILNNADGAEFFGNFIEYSRNTEVKLENAYPLTTDLQYLIEIYTGQIIEQINSGGLIAYYRDNSLVGNMAASGTGIVSGVDTKNILMSQSQIYNDYQKDYRYQENGNLLINGSSSAVQNTCRSIVDYKDISFSETDVGITQFPASIGNIIWGGSIPMSFIMELSLDLSTRQYTATSRLLDI